MQDYISGIQQVGIGVKDASYCLQQYAQLFGMNTLVFDDVAEATLMTRYTGGNVYQRRAALSLNMQGGGGLEIWQFRDREPAMAATPAQYGDLGIYAAKIKCWDLKKAHATFSLMKDVKVSALQRDGKGKDQFWVRDEQGNVFNIVSCSHWFQQKNQCVGGVCGAVIGVSDMDASVTFYQALLNIDQVAFDETGEVTDGFSTERRKYRRVLMQKAPNGKGAFGKLLGSIELELVQCLDRRPGKIYENRFWGDCGFIHLCFDVFDMCGLKQHMEQAGYSFTVDSVDSFGMDQASGRFCYLEDPDGTLMELVETHKVPVFKKLGLYLDLKKRNLEKPLPDWMIKMLSLSKVR
jgi:catechol 2,3-dioxygenase-like lactoylglutathione lyase family enzyme